MVIISFLFSYHQQSQFNYHHVFAKVNSPGTRIVVTFATLI